jgi:hypothetical protein
MTRLRKPEQPSRRLKTGTTNSISEFRKDINMSKKSKKTRELDDWERLAVQVALTDLYNKWEKQPRNTLHPDALLNLAELKLDIICVDKVILA